ncbi:MAG TPA: hypothetical protein VLI40_09170 [Gemmatimonadaceae bacterium]|nr:hypothetical protein [Gemmatimonadaceae bacterium]
MTILISLLLLLAVTSPTWILLGMAIMLVRRWSGGWRLAAVLPLALPVGMGFRLARDLRHDATSHNLWPFEVAGTSTIALAVLTLVFVAHTRWQQSLKSESDISTTPPNER